MFVLELIENKTISGGLLPFGDGFVVDYRGSENGDFVLELIE